ncbi:hypothetical protein CANARDRAFT_30795 [[Candida] arabinofermentans NRRL YB-2248]|uniref:Uncharacterized protein n=1 Tax=[Candida] arabinofermentans NRRL YB-2248 TaxID=983967 RepID=A0A1E4SSV5_9ASCO|nr:hypothetical protein CANARDRAFT_30795 [[Candida] arabinofermentans NRRL YB-2248]
MSFVAMLHTIGYSSIEIKELSSLKKRLWKFSYVFSRVNYIPVCETKLIYQIAEGIIIEHQTRRFEMIKTPVYGIDLDSKLKLRYGASYR